jgi:hypothetical protein
MQNTVYVNVSFAIFSRKKGQQVDAGEVPKEKLRSNKLASNLAKKIKDILFLKKPI